MAFFKRISAQLLRSHSLTTGRRMASDDWMKMADKAKRTLDSAKQAYDSFIEAIQSLYSGDTTPTSRQELSQLKNPPKVDPRVVPKEEASEQPVNKELDVSFLKDLAAAAKRTYDSAKEALENITDKRHKPKWDEGMPPEQRRPHLPEDLPATGRSPKQKGKDTGPKRSPEGGLGPGSQFPPNF